MKYGITDDALESLSIDDAIELARTRKKEFEDKSVLLNPERSVRKDARPPKPIDKKKEVDAFKHVRVAESASVQQKPVPPIEPKKPDLVSEIVNAIKSIKSDDENAVIIIKGDIHIHLNFER